MGMSCLGWAGSTTRNNLESASVTFARFLIQNINKPPLHNSFMLPDNLMKDIASFAYSDVDEWQVALDEFHQLFEEREPTEDEMDGFETDYVFNRKHSLYRKTFVRLFVECFEELYGKEWSKDIITLEENFESYFEVTENEGSSLIVKDLLLEDAFHVKYPPPDDTSKGDILSGRIFRWRDQYYFFGPLFLHKEKEAQENARIFTEVVRDSYRNATDSFLEYFGTKVTIFKDQQELEEKLNEFLSWFFKNKMPPGIFSEEEVSSFTHNPVTFEEVDNKKEIALIIDYHRGHMVIPEYGFYARLFSGRWEDVPGYKEMAKKILFEEDFPSYLIREMIENNPESSVHLYSQVFPQVKTKEDLIQLFAKHRRDWGREHRREGALFG